MSPEYALIVIKTLHTVIWAVMAAAIVAIPIVALRGQLRCAGGLTALILAECIVLALNQGRCPLTNVAARFTGDQAANSDIYLPLWLAKHNKTVFGLLFLAGEFIWLREWLEQRIAQKNGVTRR